MPLGEQLATLVDTSNSNPALPTGHPFLDVQSASYRSATSSVGNPSNAFNVFFGSGVVSSTGVKGNVSGHAWCVRGGQAYDGQDVLNAAPAP